jgi:hypothetical protein
VAAAGVTSVVPDGLLQTIVGELSVDNALAQTAAIAARTRYPNSQGFFDAAEYVALRAREYGLQNVRIERFPQREPLWDAEEAELSLVTPALQKITTVLAERSADGDVTAELVNGISGDVSGKIVLTDQEPRTMPHGAAAVICDATGEYFGRRTPRDAILWGRAPRDAVMLMISPKDGAELRSLLQRGLVTVHVRARAKRTEPGAIGMIIGEIPGTESGHDIVVAAHLDHQFPGANDNASGSGTLLELVRTVNHLIAAGTIPKPRRTLRFWWTTEIVAEQAYFRLHPEEVKNIILAVVLDQAGGQRNAENNLISIRNPEWLPHYGDDLINNLVSYVRDHYAPAEHEPDPLVTAPDGGRQSLQTDFWDYQPITDEVAFEARGIGIGGITLAVPSLTLIHTNLDTVDQLDPTWMKRSALLTLVPVLYIANAGPTEARAILLNSFQKAAARLALSDDPNRDLPMEQKRLDSVRALDPQLDPGPYQERLRAIETAMSGTR